MEKFGRQWEKRKKRVRSGEITEQQSEPANKRFHGNAEQSPRTEVPQTSEAAMIQIQIIEAKKLVDPFKVQKFFDTLFGRKVEIKARGSRLGVLVLSAKEKENVFSLSKIENYPVKVFKTRPEPVSKVVITGVPLELTTEDIKTSTGSTTAYRITKKKKGVVSTTTAVILTYPKGEAPERVRFAYLVFRTRPYVQEPLRCFKCNGFGHKAKDCRNAIKCPLCTKDHGFKSCPEKEKDKKERPRVCASCGKNGHCTGSKTCPKYVFSMKVNSAVAKEGISYAAALKKVVSKKPFTKKNTAQKKPEQMSKDTPKRAVLKRKRLSHKLIKRKSKLLLKTRKKKRKHQRMKKRQKNVMNQ